MLVYGWMMLVSAACGHPKSQAPPQQKAPVDSSEILRPTFQVFGYRDGKDRERQVVATWYGFRYKVVAGCEVSDSLLRSIEQHNKITDSVLTSRLGPSYRQRFQRSVDSLYAVDSAAIEIARSDEFVRDFERSTEKHNEEYNFYPNLTYIVHFTPLDHQKLVDLQGYGVVHDWVRRVSYLRITVDMEKKKVVHIDKTVFGD